MGFADKLRTRTQLPNLDVVGSHVTTPPAEPGFPDFASAPLLHIPPRRAKRAVSGPNVAYPASARLNVRNLYNIVTIGPILESFINLITFRKQPS